MSDTPDLPVVFRFARRSGETLAQLRRRALGVLHSCADVDVPVDIAEALHAALRADTATLEVIVLDGDIAVAGLPDWKPCVGGNPLGSGAD